MSGESLNERSGTWQTMRSGISGWLRRGQIAKQPPGPAPDPTRVPNRNPEMTIRQVMTANPITIEPDAPLHRALELLLQQNLSAVPVVDENGRVVGLLNERHLLTALGNPEATHVFAVMDAEPVVVGADEQIVEVVDRLMSINVRQVLVLEEMTAVGIVTRADLMPAILEVFRERARRVSMVRRPPE